MRATNGYVQTDQTKTYTLVFGPASNAIPESPAKGNHGNTRHNQRPCRVPTYEGTGCFFLTCPSSAPSVKMSS
jgi:hypothetical protein